MSWHGSLTCTYCYERGHTRRKCPEMKKRHDEYEALLAKGEEDGASWGQKGAWREYKNQQEGLKESNKVCAFCGKKGHRVNTCPDRLAVVDQLKEVDDWFIPFAKKILTEMGIGIGTIIPYSGYSAGEYITDAPAIVTGFAGRERTGCLSVVQLWEGDWLRLEVTNSATMSKHLTRVSNEFVMKVYERLFELFEIEGWNWEQSYYDETNRDIRSAHSNFFGAIGSPPRRYSEKLKNGAVISPLASAFEDTGNASFGWNFSQKREVNKLFRDSKTALVDEGNQYRVKQIHALLKTRGLI